MVEVVVNAFSGIHEQTPSRFKVIGSTYQDIATMCIRSGLNPGSLFGLQGEVIVYTDTVTMTELNYIMADNCPYQMTVRCKGQSLTIPYGPDTYLQDIQNALVAHNMSISFLLGIPSNQNISLMDINPLDQLSQYSMPLTDSSFDGLRFILPESTAFSCLARLLVAERRARLHFHSPTQPPNPDLDPVGIQIKPWLQSEGRIGRSEEPQLKPDATPALEPNVSDSDDMPALEPNVSDSDEDTIPTPKIETPYESSMFSWDEDGLINVRSPFSPHGHRPCIISRFLFDQDTVDSDLEPNVSDDSDDSCDGGD